MAKQYKITSVIVDDDVDLIPPGDGWILKGQEYKISSDGLYRERVCFATWEKEAPKVQSVELYADAEFRFTFKDSDKTENLKISFLRSRKHQYDFSEAIFLDGTKRYFD